MRFSCALFVIKINEILLLNLVNICICVILAKIQMYKKKIFAKFVKKILLIINKFIYLDIIIIYHIIILNLKIIVYFLFDINF